MKKKIYIFDIDGVICKTKGMDYENAKPLRERIAKINLLFKHNTIYYYTSRGFKTGIDWRPVTEAQFKYWGVKYDKLMFGKPYFDVFVDDHAHNDKIFFGA